MNRSTALDAILLSAGRISFVGFWFIAVLIVYRGLGKSAQGLLDAGSFAFCVASVKMAAGFISDPIDLAVMRQAPRFLRSQPARAFDVLRASLALRMSAAIAIAGLVAFIAPYAGQALSEAGAAAPYGRLVALSIVGDAVVRALLSIMQVQERFRIFLLIEGFVSIFRFIAILLLWGFGAIRVDLVLACYAGASFAVSGLGLFFLPAALFASRRILLDDLIDFVHYLKWIVPAMLLAAINERLDILIVYTFVGAAAAGLYGAALTLALIPDIIAGCLSTLIQPRIVGLHASGVYATWTARFIGYALPICAAAYALSLVLAEPFFSLALGPKYVAAAPAFHWLLAGTLFWLSVTPLPMTLVSVAAPRRVVLVTLAQLTIVIVGGLILVPRWGWLGMAQTVFAMRVIVALLLLFAARGVPVVRDPAAPSLAL